MGLRTRQAPCAGSTVQVSEAQVFCIAEPHRLGERCAAGGRPVDGLAAAVDVAVEEHAAKDAQLRRLVGGVERQVRRLPVAPHAKPASQTP